MINTLSDYERKLFYKHSSYYKCDNCGYGWYVKKDSRVEVEDDEVTLGSITYNRQIISCPNCGCKITTHGI